MESTISLLSLIVLILVIVIGFLSKKNMGVIALAAALIIGHIGGLNDNQIIAGFPLSLFINISGIFFFFSIAECNGVIQLLAQKVISRLPKSRRLYPIFVFIVIAILSLLDTGSMAIYTFTPMITMSIAIGLGVNPLMVGLITIFAACIGNFSPIGMAGIAMAGIAAGSGYTNVTIPMLCCGVVTFAILSAIVYVAFGGFKKQGTGEVLDVSTNVSTQPFNRNQKIILGMIVVLIFGVMILGVNPGLSAYLCGAILLIMNVADEKEVFQRTPWGLIIMIVGFGTLMGVTSALGGVTLLAQFLSSISNRYIAAPILSFTSSVMSIFSFALAGPIPTLIPTVATISEAVGGAAKEIEMVAGICIGGFAASVSPLSLGGAILISAYNQIKNPDKKETNKVFNTLLVTAILGSLIAAVISGTGIYGLFT